jgi:hypothetical protein
MINCTEFTYIVCYLPDFKMSNKWRNMHKIKFDSIISGKIRHLASVALFWNICIILSENISKSVTDFFCLYCHVHTKFCSSVFVQQWLWIFCNDATSIRCEVICQMSLIPLNWREWCPKQKCCHTDTQVSMYATDVRYCFAWGCTVLLTIDLRYSF